MLDFDHLDFDVGEAVFLTYTGLSAAFIALGMLIIFIMLVRLLEHWRGWRATSNAPEELTYDPDFLAMESSGGLSGRESRRDAEMVAAIAAALALSARASAHDSAGSSDAEVSPLATGQGWRGQGRLEAFDARRVWRRGR